MLRESVFPAERTFPNVSVEKSCCQPEFLPLEGTMEAGGKHSRPHGAVGDSQQSGAAWDLWGDVLFLTRMSPPHVLLDHALRSERGIVFMADSRLERERCGPRDRWAGTWHHQGSHLQLLLPQTLMGPDECIRASCLWGEGPGCHRAQRVLGGRRPLGCIQFQTGRQMASEIIQQKWSWY